MNFCEEVKHCLIDLENMKDSHLSWAECFEANPEIEKKYISTGEWDDAKTHREFISKYDRIIKLIQTLYQKGLR